MLDIALIPVVSGALFFIGYLFEKDEIFKYVFFFVSMALFTSAFFVNVEVASTTYDAVNGITTYLYQADSSLNALGMGFGIGIALSLSVLLAIRLIWTRFNKVL